MNENSRSCKNAQSASTLRAPDVKVKRVYRSHRKQRQGAAVVEFAVVAPVFVLLVFGMIEFGRAVMVQQVLVNASREGARQAVLDGSTVAEIEDRVSTYLDASSVDGETIQNRWKSMDEVHA